MYNFSHETLHAYEKALAVARWIGRQSWPRGSGWLRDQAVRAAGSAVLNIAEGRARMGATRRHHYRIALGSAAEACAALDLTTFEGVAEQQRRLREVGAMLSKMSR